MQVRTANLERLSVMATDEIVISSQRIAGTLNVLLYNPKRNKFRRADWNYAGTLTIKRVLPAVEITYKSPIDGDPIKLSNIGPDSAAKTLCTSGYRYNDKVMCQVLAIGPSTILTHEMVTENGQFSAD